MQPIDQTERVVRNWHVFVTREFRIKPAAFGTKLLVLWVAKQAIIARK